MVIKTRSTRSSRRNTSPATLVKDDETTVIKNDERSTSPVPGLFRSDSPESPIPSLTRASTIMSSATLSSFEYSMPPDDVTAEEESTSSDDDKSTLSSVSSRFATLRQNKAFKWICGAAMKFIIISLFIRMQQRGTDKQQKKSSADDDKLLEKLHDLSLPSTHDELSKVNDELAGLDPKDILQWAHHQLHASPEFDDEDSHPLVQATSFGPTGLVILDHLSEYNLLETIPVITMDTLHLFKESYTFYDTVESTYKEKSIDLTITKPLDMIEEPLLTKEEFNDAYSSTLWKTDPHLYTRVTKLEPMQQKLEEWKTAMWITGRRRSQGGERGKLDVLEFEPYPQEEGSNTKKNSSPFHSSKGRWKLNPLAYWSYDQVWSYIRNNNVPYNPLYDQGYTSIGDEMTTSKPVVSDEGGNIDPAQLERSGRFALFGASNKECGLHVDLDLDPADMKLPDDDSDEEKEEVEDAENVTCDIEKARQGECASD